MSQLLCAFGISGSLIGLSLIKVYPVIFFLCFAFLMCDALYLNHKQVLTIYSDYTDLAMTAVGTLGMVPVYILCALTMGNQPVIMAVVATAFMIQAIFVLRSSWQNNAHFIFALTSIITKYFISLIIPFGISFVLFFSPGIARQDGESDITYELRRQHAIRRRSVVWVAALALIYVFVTKVLIRTAAWSPPSVYFSTKMPHLLKSAATMLLFVACICASVFVSGVGKQTTGQVNASIRHSVLSPVGGIEQSASMASQPPSAEDARQSPDTQQRRATLGSVGGASSFGRDEPVGVPDTYNQRRDRAARFSPTGTSAEGVASGRGDPTTQNGNADNGANVAKINANMSVPPFDDIP